MYNQVMGCQGSYPPIFSPVARLSAGADHSPPPGSASRFVFQYAMKFLVASGVAGRILRLGEYLARKKRKRGRGY